MGIIILVYLVGCLAVLLDLSYKTWERTNFMVSYTDCMLTVISEKRTLNYILLSWIYFLAYEN